jgi:hypothetical protein
MLSPDPFDATKENTHISIHDLEQEMEMGQLSTGLAQYKSRTIKTLNQEVVKLTKSFIEDKDEGLEQ